MKRITVLAFAAALPLLAALAPTTASAWSEKNCMAECRQTTVGAAGYRACVAKIPCSRFRGGTSVSDAQVRQRSQHWNAQHGGPHAASSSRSQNLCGPKAVHFDNFAGCLEYRHRTGWGSGAASAFCHRICKG